MIRDESRDGGPAGERVQRVATAALFIVGAPRSGTTWLQRMLLEDPRCCGGQESHFFVSFGRVLADFDRKAALERPHGLAGYWRREALVEAVRELWVRTVRPVVERAPGAERLVEKTPDHALWMETIDEVLPESRFIHVVRDSRAVCASLMAASRETWGAGWAPRTAAAAASRWREHVDAAEHAGRRLGGQRFLRIRYEDLHAEPVSQLARVWAFAGLPAEQSVLEATAERHRFGGSAAGGGTPFTMVGELEGPSPPEPPGFFRQGAIDGWRGELGPVQRWIVWRKTAALMRSLGYDRGGRRTSTGTPSRPSACPTDPKSPSS